MNLFLKQGLLYVKYWGQDKEIPLRYKSRWLYPIVDYYKKRSDVQYVKVHGYDRNNRMVETRIAVFGWTKHTKRWYLKYY